MIQETASLLHHIIYPTRVAHPEHFLDASEYPRDDLIDAIEPELKAVARKLSIPYKRPKLKRGGEIMLVLSPKIFVRRYENELAFSQQFGIHHVMF